MVGESVPGWSAHNATRVNRVHQDGFRGDGVVVAMIDSGIDYNHPALGGGFGPGFKVEGGYDLAGDSYEAGGATTPDADPMDCAGHGTHVAGIIGSSDGYNPGVAPDARLRMYKVFGCGGSATEDIVIAGFLRAFDEGADVISASLGSALGFPYTASSIVISRIQAAGVVVTAAAGNSGGNGKSLGPLVLETCADHHYYYCLQGPSTPPTWATASAPPRSAASTKTTAPRTRSRRARPTAPRVNSCGSLSSSIPPSQPEHQVYRYISGVDLLTIIRVL